MSKPLSITLIIIFFIGGILLGNQYGRRDVVNSRPPEVQGQLGKPAIFDIPDESYSLSYLRLYNSSQDIVYGGVSLLEKEGLGVEVVLDIWGVPENEDNTQSDFKVVLVNSDKSTEKDITTFSVDGNQGIKIKFSTDGDLSQGQYMAVIREGSTEPLLLSESIQ